MRFGIAPARPTRGGYGVSPICWGAVICRQGWPVIVPNSVTIKSVPTSANCLPLIAPTTLRSALSSLNTSRPVLWSRVVVEPIKHGINACKTSSGQPS
jgi:hypothetical protein